VNDATSPDHYKIGGIECIDYLRAKLTPEEFAGFLRGNALKYLSRAGHKGDATEDYRKALWYVRYLANLSGVEGQVRPIPRCLYTFQRTDQDKSTH